ncbi:ASKHA domain-containing protein [Desulfonatronovibrio hydrogenovorans]|uniref:ASKHA domain-containing protein n=1 Tax=Desulfonatronovibrio hydrogenovorans TaxID=53245 RepID=UPI000691C930|nr:ASKHA domain-containing protein [Desulfonatronovibrio hydrogenovorans]
MVELVKVHVSSGAQSETHTFDPGRTLALNLFVHGYYSGVALCSGIGNCGKCQVLFRSSSPAPTSKDLDFFSPWQIRQGMRLACSHFPGTGQHIEVFPQKQEEEPVPDILDSAAGAGIDIGTTSIKWKIFNSGGGGTSGKTINPQMGAGPDVMSRLSFASESSQNMGLLTGLIRSEIGAILNNAGYLGDDVCITGNPAMIYLLLGRDISGLSTAPYTLEYKAGQLEKLAGTSIQAYIPALFSPFVGADISAGLTYLLQCVRPEYPFLFADLGTNGELVLALSPDCLLATSVALGPALEGIGLRFGSPHARGVAARFVLTKDGLGLPEDWKGRVSGSGYISLVAHLLRLKVLSAQGHFQNPVNPLASRVSTGIRDRRLWLGSDFFLGARDIEEILKVKAAFSLGLSFLCTRAGISPEMLKKVCIGGDLGRHADPADLETLGFFPSGTSHKCQILGNTSLLGAVLLAKRGDFRMENQRLGQWVESINMADDEEYLAGRFARHMIFDYPELGTRSAG